MVKKLLFSCFCSLTFLSAQAQLFVDTTYTVEQMIQGFFGGTGDSISNISYTGAPVSLAFFEGSQSNIGLNAGLLICTGAAKTAIGPNDTESAGTVLEEPGHPWLSALINNVPTYDASVINLHITPTTDTLRFKYVFGSEEYKEYVNTQFNDVFAFFINGPGLPTADSIYVAPDTTYYTPSCLNCVDTFLILTEQYCYLIDSTVYCFPSGDTIYSYCVNIPCEPIQVIYPGYWYYSPGGLNIAQIPGNNLPVAINNLNQFVNTQYFTDNASGSTIQYDAFTTPLWAEVPVVPGETYTITIAVADAGDGVFDSGVFLSIESIGGDSLLPVDVAFEALGNNNTFTFNNNTFWATDWQWDFGDGATSTERNPEHTFASDGTYSVQLTASNWCSEKTYTSNVTVGLSATNTVEQAMFTISPNPTTGNIVLQLPDAATAQVRIIDMDGRVIVDRSVNDGNRVSLEAFAQGVYTVQVVTNGQVFSQKLVKI